MTWYIYLIAGWLILFGFIKTFIATSSLVSLPIRDFFEKIPVANIFINNDRSFAGFYSELGLIAFGLYSFFHGLAILRWLPSILNALLGTQTSLIYFYTVFAIAFIGFYSLVLFSHLPIDKNLEYEANYWLNIAAGCFFIWVILLVFLWTAFKQSNFYGLAFWTVVFLLLTYTIVRIVYYAYTGLNMKPHLNDALVYITIPLNLA